MILSCFKPQMGGSSYSDRRYSDRHYSDKHYSDKHYSDISKV